MTDTARSDFRGDPVVRDGKEDGTRDESSSVEASLQPVKENK